MYKYNIVCIKCNKVVGCKGLEDVLPETYDEEYVIPSISCEPNHIGKIDFNSVQEVE